MSVTAAIREDADYRGPAVLGRGLRPFFLLAAVYAVVALGLWMAMLTGHLALPTIFDPLTWHTHEMLFGFVQAVIAGFLLTAVPNWTGRPPVRGMILAWLAALWLVGRLAVAASELAPLAAAMVDLLFPVALLGLLGADVLAARSKGGAMPLLALALLAVANLLTHLAAIGVLPEAAETGRRLGLAVIVLLIALIGGRVVPAFTGNWLELRGERRPPPMGLPDRVALLATAGALLSWSVAPSAWTAPLLAFAALAQLRRLLRWRGHRTLAEPLVWILHLAYLWIPLGLALLAAAMLWPSQVPVSAALHALSAGAIATMILAMMTRATLGHTGRPLHADLPTLTIYLLALAGAAARIAASMLPEVYLPLLSAAAFLWVAAFGLFLIRYGPMLLRPREDGMAP